MFTNLVASGKQRRSFWNVKTITGSIVAHSLLLGGIVYASVIAPDAAEGAVEEETVTFIDIQEEAPPPPPPPESAPPPDIPPAPQGFQDLIPPDIIRPDIPPVDLATDLPALASDYSGVGSRGGTAAGVGSAPVPNASPSATESYRPAVLEDQPRLLLSQQELSRLMQRYYPRHLLDSRIGGRVTVQFVITADGLVDPSTITIVESEFSELGEATKEAVREFRFVPGRYLGQNVRVLIEIPITWQAR